jgi:hypothetical protein
MINGALEESYDSFDSRPASGSGMIQMLVELIHIVRNFRVSKCAILECSNHATVLSEIM